MIDSHSRPDAMKLEPRSVLRLLLSVVLVGGTVALASSRYFYWVSTGSEFLWLSLASTAIIHLRVRPRWSEALLLGLSTALLTTLVSFIAHFSFQWISVFAHLGLSSLVMLGTRAVWAEGEEQKLLLWAFIPGVLFVAFGWLTPPLLR